MIPSLDNKLVFENPYEVIEWLSRQINSAQAWSQTSKRLAEAHNYCQKYLMPEAWGENVWHSILDDAIRMRKEKEEVI